MKDALAKSGRTKLHAAVLGLFGAAIGVVPLAHDAHAAATNTPAANAGSAVLAPELVPLPAKLQRGDGEFALDAAVTIYANNAEARAVAHLLRDELAATQDLQLSLRSGAPQARKGEADPSRYVQFVAEPIAANADARAKERYSLEITARGIRLAGPPAGLFYGYQTLRQLLPVARGAQSLRVQALSIEDQPRFVYRGMHLDVGRHLYPLAFIKRYVDLMARYKLNTFHWHLTEDQGWRIEIKRYPKLTSVGSKRKETVLGRNIEPYVGDGQPYGGFYTQDEVREVVAYARARHIMVIPEIEMPGHSLAALAAYPELACTPGPFEVGGNWGVYDDIYCPKEETFKFLENVLDEVVALFPAPFVHIGGDEAPKTRWKSSEVAQAVMRREGLKDEHELQSYFIQRMEKFLHSRGKRIIGWDEILEGGLAADATVMSWRGEAGGIAAAQQGHDVIMTPTQCCYFDYGQGPAAHEQWNLGGELSLDKVYGYDPVPKVLDAAQARHVLGVQGNVWTEYLKTPAMVEYMVFPRLLALAEVAWTPQPDRDFGDFQRRLRGQFPQLDREQVGYRIPAPQGLTDALQIEQDDAREYKHRFTLTPAVPGATIRYTLDGSEPGEASPVYQGPIEVVVPLGQSRELRTVTVLADGRRSGVHSASVRYRSYLPALAKPARAASGLGYRVYEGLFSSLDEFERAGSPVAQGAASSLDVLAFGRKNRFGVRFDGFIEVPADGVYRYALQGDDRSALYIDGEPVIRNETYDQTVVASVPLRRGWHRLRIDWYQREGGLALRLQSAAPGQELRPLDAREAVH
ncbi:MULTISPECIES: family 20 glycosylhydrolase [unclassified Lysobacter]|uniref:family 20 glycosylhydrolase n=1 Tax=unclassified Lysobacter TaxID=2635362 RepID=UPI001BEC8312|nr:MULTISPECIES: family 20 glycosylhydrolase [unclassified Lysobacter]MBT2745335.1 family 20 glycosylhydrolase [Lysobacter sp. ISL-42]MBT2751932.1 family 20 glycosylhydrolase [Lysobacter sp. ISL-50]MBT2777897.1 family 20 glycosylhydrolase [Lysobacter sp. ISL-54]MBT2783153.1 family 20 glycosylhydrolase [Lysobacter sp. ISL-52]